MTCTFIRQTPSSYQPLLCVKGGSLTQVSLHAEGGSHDKSVFLFFLLILHRPICCGNLEAPCLFLNKNLSCGTQKCVAEALPLT